MTDTRWASGRWRPSGWALSADAWISAQRGRDAAAALPRQDATVGLLDVLHRHLARAALARVDLEVPPDDDHARSLPGNFPSQTRSTSGS
jgi:hypothetical protein